ncbi:MAG TPA: restriction endonuclease [Anaerolineales bacterium]|jgi:restriction system protein|nr:restriction endonuclease [Anaerolineales bacterium]
MADITLSRIGELLRSVFELLWNKPEGMPARDIFAFLPEITQLTSYERDYSPPTNIPRYERIVRLATVPLVRAGWLVKNNKGRWFITEEGRQACRRYPNAQELYKEALRQFEDARQNVPSYAMVVEEAEEMAWEQIQRYLQGTRQSEFRTLVADLMVAMGYHIGWVAPPEKDKGQIDMVAYVDPIGVKGPRIFIQIKHKGQAVTIEGLRSFLSVLGTSDYGLLVSSGGFTEDALQRIRRDHPSRLTLLELESFFDLWIKFYSELSSEAQDRLPLKKIYFLSLTE